MPEFNVPDEFLAIIDQGMARDKAYFQKHPNATHYIRNAIPGECWPRQTPKTVSILVEQIRPGVRTRRIISSKPIIPYPGCEELCEEMNRTMAVMTREEVREAIKRM